MAIARMGGWKAVACAAAALAALSVGAAAAQSEIPVGPVQQTFAIYGIDEGLPSLSTTDLALDDRGTLWIGTREGAVRFDGERYRTFGRRDGLPSALVLDLEIDRDDTVWAATLGGLARFDGERFQTVDLPGAGGGDAVEALGLDAGGYLMAGAAGGAWRCDRSRCIRVFTAEAGESVSSLALDRTSGELWLAGSFGLVRWRDQELERWTTAEGLPSHATRGLLVDRFGVLWIRQLRALLRLDTNSRLLTIAAELPAATLSSQLLEDRLGVLWVGSDHGLHYRTAEGWRRIGVENGLPGEGIAALLEDGEGALWIATANAGLTRWLGRDRFAAWTRDTGLPHDLVTAVARGSDGSLAFGTSRGLAILSPDGRTLRRLDRASGLAAEVVQALVSDGSGGFWIGSAGGLSHVDRQGRATGIDANGALPVDLSVAALGRAPDGTLWLGTSHGLWRGRSDPSAVDFEQVDLPGDRADSRRESILDLLIEPSGVLWTAGRFGLVRMQGADRRRLTVEDGLANDFVASLARAGDGAIWVGYQDAHGVSELHWQGDRRPEIRQFGRPEGMHHEQTNFVRADALGRIWIGTTRGLAVRTSRGFASFGRSDGLLSEDSSRNAFLADADGTVWIGSPRGAIAARLSRDDLAPRADLEARVLSVSLGGLRYDPDATPKVPFTARTLEIAFAARTFRSPQEVEFRYQLLGVDENPVVTGIRSLRYPALPHGDHQFVVSARLEGGGWGPPATTNFSVLPPWWATVPARAGAVVTALLLGLLGDRVRTRRLRARRKSLEDAVAARTRELAASREELARKNEELAHLSLTDPLTGLKNRRYAWEFLADEVLRVDREWQHAATGSEPEARLVFFLMDVDLFKSINDQHGHEIGDKILIEAAERVREATRIHDIAVRWGGEEFLVVARDLPPSEWSRFASRLRRAISHPAYVPSSEIGPVTCTASLGYAAYPFGGVVDLGWQQILKLSDLALYAVKQCGRDADLGVEPGPGWKGQMPPDLLAAQVGGTIRLRWGNISRGSPTT